MCSNPRRAAGVSANLASPAVYCSAKSGSSWATLWKSPRTSSCDVQVSPYVWMTGVLPASAMASLLAANCSYVVGASSPSSS